MVSFKSRFNIKAFDLRQAFAARIRRARSATDILRFFKNNPRLSRTSLQGLDMFLTLLMSSPRAAAFLRITPPQLRLLMIAAPVLRYLIQRMLRRTGTSPLSRG